MVDRLLESVPPAPWIILFSPLAATLLIMLFAMKRPKMAGVIALAGILVSLVLSVFMFNFHVHATFLPAESGFAWIELAGLRVEFGYLIDRLSLIMLLVVTGVGSCIFFYSVGYMKGDESIPRYFASLSFFAFSMIGIVLANNLLMLFMFWELVAVSSYLLIGFWFQKPSAADAGNKAFIVNRAADFGFVVGILYIWMLSGAGGNPRTFTFTELSALLPNLVSNGLLTQNALLAASLLVFCGVIGKSAQFPLYIWLPDAMEGPTPVSALIHAATMVAAGVYLMARTFFLIGGSPEALGVIAVVGCLTAFLAALLAVVQNDIKKILAYSTISQLGYMVMALGLGGPTPAMFHLTTHAFFKALLFLGAGAMIHALHTQDIWEMGGLLKKMPVTAVTFLIGTAALCGIPPFSGFFSKDEILTLAYNQAPALFGASLFTAGLTAFYMTRVAWIAVLGPSRAHKHGHEHSYEAPNIMKFPLIILAFFSSVAGLMGIPEFLMESPAHAMHLDLAVAGGSVLAAALGIAAGTFAYAKVKTKEDPLVGILGKIYTLIVRKYYLDDLFSGIAALFKDFAAKTFFWFDRNIIIQKGVNGTAAVTSAFGSLLRRAQTGYVQTYAFVFGFGVIALIFIFMKGGR